MKLNLKLESVKKALGVDDQHLIISGPCSAESEEQVLTTCKALAKSGKIHLLRGGVWKPRTRPNSFEGFGEEALKWMVKAKEETGLPIATEVANANHVELCLKYGVDLLWVGARTTVNPFSVQEIADALKGVDVPVLVKNPINPDLQLWIGAIERINQAGITKLGALHRGFSTTQPTPFRNAPMWEMAIELRRLIPEMEVFCDPSHIAGTRDIIPLISQKAIDLDMDGLMIESHFQPQSALSDAKQQIKPAAMEKLLGELIFRQAELSDDMIQDKLEGLREQIDVIDENIMHEFASRMNVVDQIGEYKRDQQVTILQMNRWSEILEDRVAGGKALGLSSQFVKSMLTLVHEESIRRQNEIMNSDLAKA
ncbi:MAG: chorismate mutase [Bacteroidota bacterium]